MLQPDISKKLLEELHQQIKDESNSGTQEGDAVVNKSS
jgi:hypothetical protein